MDRVTGRPHGATLARRVRAKGSAQSLKLSSPRYPTRKRGCNLSSARTLEAEVGKTDRLKQPDDVGPT